MQGDFEVNIIYRVNGAITTKSLAEWYFGKGFVAKATKSAADAKKSVKVWQNGTGYLTIEIF